MDLGINGKIALVTAASKGLGKAVALRLVLEKAHVIICSRNLEELKKTQTEIMAISGEKVEFYVCDVSREDQIKQMIDAIIADQGALDILLCNAGGPPPGRFDDFTSADYNKALELNLFSTINLCRYSVPVMQERKWGRIVVITSVSVKQPIDSLILSNTARAGVTGFLKTLSNLVAKDGITVNAICPGYTKTQRVENLAKNFALNGQGSEEDFYKTLKADIPMQRLGTPDEFAQAVAFLSSEGAGYITGVSLQVDGGYIKSLF
jgi:3-oxoacyl-[acyl-carrier protein] reductase